MRIFVAASIFIAGALLSMAIDWFPFNGNRLIVREDLAPWAVLALIIACGLYLLWRRFAKRGAVRERQAGNG
jgi:hypothetical protein